MNSRALALPLTETAKPSITLRSGREGTLSDPSPEVLKLLQDLRRGEKPQSPLDLSQLRLAGLDLTELDLSGADLSGSDLSGAQLAKTRMMHCKLCGANLTGADLSGAEFAGADLSDCCLEGVRAEGAGFGMTTMQRVRFFGAEMDHATFSKSDLSNSDLRCAKLRRARLHESLLTQVDLSQADLTGANLEGADVKGADFKDTILCAARLSGLIQYESANWIGVDIRDIHFTGAYLMRRFVLDQNFLKEFRTRGRLASLAYQVWWITSDCGRSLSRWGLWTAALVLLFSWLYTMVGIDYGSHPTFLSPLYYSVVTLTTLGYGDVVPKTPMAQILAMLEVVTGYVMLGGLLSIFSNRMARRAD